MHPPIPHAVHQARPPATHPHGAPKPARSRLTPRRLRVAAFACLAVAASAPTSFARSTPLVIRVDAGALAPTPDGLSWSTAYNSLDDALLAARAALDAASPPARVELWLTAGLYRPTLDADLQPTPGRDATFSLIDDLHILGGFTGSELTPDQRPNDPPDTILSGELGDNATIDDNAFNVVTFIAPPAADLAEALLDTLTIRDGNAIGQPDGANPLAGEGAAVATRFSDLTLRRVALLSNRAHTGGAVSTRNGVLTVERSDFLDNRAQGDAGALNSQSQLLVRDSTFASNDARFGGAILACCRTVRIERTDFFGNTATWGGAIYTPSGTLELLAVNGYDNTASRGGFLNNAADAHAANLRLGSNTAANGGAVYNAASLTIDNGEFTRNLAFENGGALNSASGQLTLCNATLLANRSFIQGGAVYLGFGSATLTNAVVADNQDGFGDDAPAQLAASALATLDAQTVLIDAPLAGLPITDPIIAAPLFADRLGPDGILGTPDDDLAPALDSPALDAASPATVPADSLDVDGDGDTSEPLPLDAAGLPRSVDIPDQHDRVGSPVDLGAREAQAQPPCPGDTNQDLLVNADDLLTVLANFGQPTTQGPVDGDFDDSGTVTADDLLTILARFGLTCP